MTTDLQTAFDSTRQAPWSPSQYLALCLAAIRGGVVRYDELEDDVRLWIFEHGEPTEASVQAWAETNFEVQFGLDVLEKRFPNIKDGETCPAE